MQLKIMRCCPFCCWPCFEEPALGRATVLVLWLLHVPVPSKRPKLNLVFASVEVLLYIATGSMGAVFFTLLSCPDYPLVPLYLLLFGFVNVPLVLLRMWETTQMTFSHIQGFFNSILLLYGMIKFYPLFQGLCSGYTAACHPALVAAVLIIISVKVLWFFLLFVVVPLITFGVIFFGINSVGFGYEDDRDLMDTRERFWNLQ